MAKKGTAAISVPEFIKRIMDAAGLKTQDDFAAKVGVSQATVSKWVRGVQDPRLQQWSGVLEYVRGNPKTAHLRTMAPDFSLDAMVDPYGPEAHAKARIVLDAFLKTLPKP